MAITKIRPVKKTLKKAIDYITDPEKTLDGSLVSSYGCSVGTADIEMNLTAQKGRQNGDRVAYHLIQSFSPEDNITPEKAHQIGMEYAKRLYGGKYEFVISTHADRGHIHNHIILNSTDYVYYKKYHIDHWEIWKIRRENDKICQENHLSVIEKTSGRRGRSKYEYECSRAGKSWKDQLQMTIDDTIRRCKTFEEFCFIMESEGYEIKRGKHIAFRGTGQERFTRSKKIGELYTEEMIRDRIEHKENYQAKETPVISKKKKSVDNILHDSGKINLITDISKCMKAQESEAYKRAVIKNNMNSLVNTMNYLIRYHLKTVDQLEAKINEATDAYDGINKSLRSLDQQLASLSEKIKFTQNYIRYARTAGQARREPLGSQFLKEHEQEIILYQAAQIYMERNRVNTANLNLKNMFDEYRELKLKKELFQKERIPAQKHLKELRTIQSNVEAALGIKLQTKGTGEKESKQRQNMDR